jgi:cyclophilin family peptidyl-prolyl cis-trans isomerase
MKKYIALVIILSWASNSSFAQLKVRSNGFVGVGTTYPYEAFQIGDRWTFLNGGTKVIGYNVRYNGSVDIRIVNDYAACIRMDNLGIKFGVADNSSGGTQITWRTPLFLNNNGNVQIGKIGGTTYISGYAYCTQGYWAGSDIRLKENIQPVENATNTILALNGKVYNFKSGFEKNTSEQKRKSYGFIAQELKTIIPDLVMESPDSASLFAINYDGLIPILVEAFKEQNLLINSLKAELVQLRGLISMANIVDKNSNGSAIILQNSPNPFYGETKISFSIPSDSKQSDLFIYDMQGLMIKKIAINTIGEGVLTINSNELKSGMYLYSLVVDGKEIGTKRMIVVE